MKPSSRTPNRISLPYPEVQIEVFNELFGMPLYSWWIVALTPYQAEEIEGTLLDDLRSQMQGPFETAEAALEWLWQRGYQNH